MDANEEELEEKNTDEGLDGENIVLHCILHDHQDQLYKQAKLHNENLFPSSNTKETDSYKILTSLCTNLQLLINVVAVCPNHS